MMSDRKPDTAADRFAAAMKRDDGRFGEQSDAITQLRCAHAICDMANNHGDLLTALKTAVGHIEHMAAFFGGKGLGYSFESLGEDMPGIRDAITKATRRAT